MTSSRKQRLAVVGGGAGGLGKVIVERLGNSRTVIALDSDASRIDEARKAMDDDPVVWKVVDICDREAVVAAIHEVVEDFGEPGVLVNCAGVGPSYLDAIDVQPDALQEIMRVNVMGAMNSCRAVVPFMRSVGWGRIVNISSVTAEGGWRSRSDYAASKAALESMSASLAVELGPFGIAVNCVAPGHMRTQMTESSGIPWERIISRTALGRLVTTHEVAEAVAFLQSEESSGITGSVLRVDAGYLANQIATTSP